MAHGSMVCSLKDLYGALIYGLSTVGSIWHMDLRSVYSGINIAHGSMVCLQWDQYGTWIYGLFTQGFIQCMDL